MWPQELLPLSSGRWDGTQWGREPEDSETHRDFQSWLDLPSLPPSRPTTFEAQAVSGGLKAVDDLS